MPSEEKTGPQMTKRKASNNLISSLEDSLETPQEKKARIRSLFIVHISMLVVSLGSSIIYTGVYPYLYQMDPGVRMIEYGIVVAADAAAQMIFSPLFGILIDRIKTVRPVALLCCFLFCAGNVLYAMVGLFDRSKLFGLDVRGTRIWMMMLARFIVGAGTGLNSAGRYYASTATLISERTTHISLLSLFQTLGFIAGPGIQAALTPIGPADIGPEGEVVWDMYTSTGWVSAATGILCFILYLPFIFKESYISDKELEAIKNMAKADGKTSTKELVRKISQINFNHQTSSTSHPSDSKDGNKVAPHPKKLLRDFSKISISLVDEGYNIADKLAIEEEATENEAPSSISLMAVFTCIYNYFAFLANFVLLETIMTKLAMDQWGWNEQDAIQRMGYVIMGAGAISVVIFAVIGPLSKRFDERTLLLVCGIVPMILGRVVMFPLPGQPYPPQWLSGHGPDQTTSLILPTNNSYNTTSFSFPFLDPRAAGNTGLDDYAKGCWYDWCKHVPRIHIAQFMVGFVVATAGYPFCLTLTGSIYSKLLGSSNPGFWLGLFATSGSLARVIGPLVVTEIYELWGTYVLFIVVTVTLIISLGFTIISWKKLIPGHGDVKEDDAAKERSKGKSGAKAGAKSGIKAGGGGGALASFEEVDEE